MVNTERKAELHTLAAVQAWLQAGAEWPVVVQGVDLFSAAEPLRAANVEHSIFLGCRMPRELAGDLVRAGATVIAAEDTYLFPAHPSELYSREALFDGYAGGSYAAATHFDKVVYEDYRDAGLDQCRDLRRLFAYRIHDLAISDAIQELIEGRKVVGIMGGHGLLRASPLYRELAFLARRLSRAGYLMVSGGGPGAMEATHLGAWFAARSDGELDAAITAMGRRSSEDEVANGFHEYKDDAWLARAWAICEEYPLPSDLTERAPCVSLGVPTWRYGHEPPAPFATHIGKYFANSVREDGLVTIARYGLIFAPGAAGTVQEAFQDATQNYYPDAFGPSPMVFYDHEQFWSEALPAPFLLDRLTQRGKRDAMRALITVAADAEQVAKAILAFVPDAG